MTSIFLQVRLDSSRLPRKALADLGGKTVTERCLAALTSLVVDRRVLVTERASAAELELLLNGTDWELFVGSKDNVLDRFVQAARATGTTTVVRATGDNPLVSATLAALTLERHRSHGADFSALDGGPTGSGVEVIEASALEVAWASQPDAYEREHVSPYLYRRPERFRIHRTPVPASCWAPEARITLDTAEDLDYLRALWAAVDQGHAPEVEELIPWLNQHPR